MSDILQMIPYYITTYGLSLLGAILIFIIGRWVARWLSRLAGKLMSRTEVDATLTNFVVNLTYIALLVFVILAALSTLGIQTTSFIAVIGAAGLAIGLALQGALSNFAAGAMILLFRPFKVGDLVEAGGAFGEVEEIQIFNTIIITPDNKTVIIPNAQITGGNIINFSAKGNIRLDLVFGIGYNDDLLKAKQILEDLVTSDERSLKDPAPTVTVLELGDNSVNFAVRPFVKVEDYWDLHFSLTEKVKLRFDEEGISIPFPQRDVHMFQESK